MAVLFYYADPRDVLATLRGASPSWIAAAIILVILDRAGNAYRWLMLLRAVEPSRHISTWAAMRVFFVSGFLGSFLPGSVGGDAVRTVALSRLRVPAADAFASVMVDRMLGVMSVVLMAAVSLLLVSDALDTRTVVTLWLAVGGLLAACTWLFVDPGLMSKMSTRLVGSWMPVIDRAVTRVLAAIRQYGTRRHTLVGVLALSIGVQVLRIGQAWSLGRALGIDAGLVWYFAFVPLIILIMLLPTSVAGLGTGALAFQLLFGTIGVPAASCFSLALLFSGMSIVGTLPGAFMLYPRRT